MAIWVLYIEYLMVIITQYEYCNMAADKSPFLMRASALLR